MEKTLVRWRQCPFHWAAWHSSPLWSPPSPEEWGFEARCLWWGASGGLHHRLDSSRGQSGNAYPSRHPAAPALRMITEGWWWEWHGTSHIRDSRHGTKEVQFCFDDSMSPLETQNYPPQHTMGVEGAFCLRYKARRSFSSWIGVVKVWLARMPWQCPKRSMASWSGGESS